MKNDFEKFMNIYGFGRTLPNETIFLQKIIEHERWGRVSTEVCFNDQTEARKLNTRFDLEKGHDGWYPCIVPVKSGMNNAEYMKLSYDHNTRYESLRLESTNRQNDIFKDISLQEYFIYELLFGLGFVRLKNMIDYLKSSNQHLFTKSCICFFVGMKDDINESNYGLASLLDLIKFNTQKLETTVYSRVKKQLNIHSLNISSLLSWKSITKDFNEIMQDCLEKIKL